MEKNFALRDLAVLLVVAIFCFVLMPLAAYYVWGGGHPDYHRKDSCMSYQHHIGLACQMYLNDSRGIWPQGETSAECLALLHPQYAETPLYFSCLANPTEPEEVDGKIINAGYLLDIAIPKDTEPMRVVLGCKRGNHKGGASVSFADSHAEFVWENNGLLDNPYFPNQDTDVYSDQPDVDGTIDCDLSSGNAPDG